MDTELEQILVESQAHFTALDLHLPPGMALDQWTAIGKRLLRLDMVTKWWIGDWAAFGLAHYDGNKKFQDPTKEEDAPREGEKPRRGRFKEFAESHGINYQTLANMAWVSRSIEPSRRRESVEWSTHAEVAALDPDDQDKWLDLVEKENLPRSVLRQQIRLSQGEQNALISDGPSIKLNATKAVDDLLAWLRDRPADFWTPARRGLWKQRLQPVAEFWGKL